MRLTPVHRLILETAFEGKRFYADAEIIQAIAEMAQAGLLDIQDAEPHDRIVVGLLGVVALTTPGMAFSTDASVPEWN